MATIKNPIPARSSFPVIHQTTAATIKAGRKARSIPATQMIKAPIMMRMINPTTEYGTINDNRFTSIIHLIDNLNMNDNLSVIQKIAS
jgi:hypothetical protein